MTSQHVANPLKIALLVGSVRAPRMADPLLGWLRSELEPPGWLRLDVIDLAEVALPQEQLAPGSGTLSPIADRLEDADGFVILTPAYNHSFPAALKNAIDWHLSPDIELWSEASDRLVAVAEERIRELQAVASEYSTPDFLESRVT